MAFSDRVDYSVVNVCLIVGCLLSLVVLAVFGLVNGCSGCGLGLCSVLVV